MIGIWSVMPHKLKYKPLKREQKDSESSEIHFLVLFNDDIHTFHFVIESLVEICNHSSVQAEQCAVMAHYNGKCEIKKGIRADLEPMKAAFDKKGLITLID